MFGLGWSEMVLIGIVALIVIGPKDLPGMFRTMGEFTGKARGMAREFSQAMQQAADESGVKEIGGTLKAAADPKSFGVNKIREATSFAKKGPETEKLSQTLSAEREAARARANEAMAEAALKRQRAAGQGAAPVEAAVNAAKAAKAAPRAEPAKPARAKAVKTVKEADNAKPAKAKAAPKKAGAAKAASAAAEKPAPASKTRARKAKAAPKASE